MALCVIVIIMGWLVREDVDLLLYWMYAMLGLAIACTLIFSVFSLAQNPKSAVQSLLGLVALIVVIGVAWAFSSDAPVVTPTAEYTDSFSLKLTDTALYATYACMVLAVVAIIIGEIRNAFK